MSEFWSHRRFIRDARLTWGCAATIAATLACQAQPASERSEPVLGLSHAALTATDPPAAGHAGCGDHASDEDDGPDVRERAGRSVRWRHRHHPGEGGVVPVRLLGLNDFHGRLSEGLLVAGRPAGGAAV